MSKLFAGFYERFIKTDIYKMRLLSSQLPFEEIAWLTQANDQYIQDLILKIDTLTEYLDSSPIIAQERQRLRKFIEEYAQSTPPSVEDLLEYLHLVELERIFIWSKVDLQCHKILKDFLRSEPDSLDMEVFLDFWRDFAITNDVDNAHAMYLTSGRWDINFILPMLRAIVYSLRSVHSAGDPSKLSYRISRYLIAPYTISLTNFETELAFQVTEKLYNLLRLFDRQTMISYVEISEELSDYHPIDQNQLISDYIKNPNHFKAVENLGVYPPLCWSEVKGIEQYKRLEHLDKTEVIESLISECEVQTIDLAHTAIYGSFHIKRLEAEYLSYNYKGFFMFVSRLFYKFTAQLLKDHPTAQNKFMNSIFNDHFYEAYQVLETNLIERP